MRRLRVFVVDDDGQGLRSTVRILSKDFDVSSAEDPNDLLIALRAGQTFDVVVSDVQMPDLNGMDLHKALESEFPSLARKTLFQTGGAPAEVLEYLAPRAPVLFRPVQPTALIRAISVLASR